MPKTKKRLRAVLYGMFAALFLAGAAMAVKTYNSYRSDRSVYDGAADAYLEKAETPLDEAPEDMAGQEAVLYDGVDGGIVLETPPVAVDFDSLIAAAPDVQGWLYCEDTAINYPVVQGKDNDQYLRHDYTGNYAVAGSIFMEAANQAWFQDSNTIIYGHHMKDGSMFAGLQKWADQAYYDGHKTMWLLTPDKNYKIELFAGYVTPADSDTYAVFQGPSEYFDKYLEQLPEKSDFKADPAVELDRDARYVVLSTCDYTFKDARYVLHGKLVPLE